MKKISVFTDKFIQSLKATDKKYYVRELNGFSILVAPTGSKTFTYIYELYGKRKYLNLGKYPQISLAEARSAFSEAYKKVHSKVDPSISIPDQELVAEELTMNWLIAKYTGHVQASKDSEKWKRDRINTLNKIYLPSMGNLKISQVGKRYAISLLEKAIQRGATAAKNDQRILRGLFEYAIEREYTTHNPFSKLTKALPALRATSRDRVLDVKEIKHWWCSLDTLPVRSRYKRALKVILLTGQRPGEVAGIHSAEIIQEKSGDWVWTIPSARSKNKVPNRVYLTKTVLELLGPLDKDSYLFPSTWLGGSMPIDINTLSQIGNKAPQRYFGLPRWTPHDLRRTMRTHLSRLGVRSDPAEALLNHLKQGMRKVYDIYEYDAEKKEALLRWETELLRILK